MEDIIFWQATELGGIDVWPGSHSERGVTGLVRTVDLYKREAERKILFGCTEQEARLIQTFHNDGPQAASLVWRPGAQS